MHAEMATWGEDFVALHSEAYHLESDRVLDPEGMAMQFMRLAFIAAHHEIRARQVPFNGDARTSIQKLKDSDGGLYGE